MKPEPSHAWLLAPYVSWSDLPAWLTFIAAALAFSLAYWQFRKQTLQLQRRQANDIDSFWARTPDISVPNTPIFSPGHAFVVVENKSGRPIRNVTCKIRLGSGPSVDPTMIGPATRPNPANPHRLTLNTSCPGAEAKVIRAHDTFGFWFEASYSSVEDIGARTVQFTDDAGLTWQMDDDLHLEKARRQAGASWPGLMSPPADTG